MLLTQLSIFVFVVLINYVRSGTIYPDTARPIVPFRNNVPSGPDVISDYTFQFRVQTPSSNYPVLKIKFPDIFLYTPADEYVCEFTQSPTSITEICVVEGVGRTFSFPKSAAGVTAFQQITAASANLTIKGLKNPAVAGGTGSGFFSIQTISRESILIDSNSFFGKIGLADPYTDFLSASISNDGASIAGYVTNYVLEFKNTVVLPKGTYFRLEFPAGYSFSNPICSLSNPATTFSCSITKSTVLIMRSLTADLAVAGATPWKIKIRNVRNPFSKGSISGFVFEAMKEGTNTIIEQSSSLNSISITAGAINDPSVSGQPLNRNLRIDYTISFFPSNTIPEGGSIEVIFPSTYVSLDSSCRIIYGLLEATSGSLTCTGDSPTLTVTISGFSETSPQFIQLKIFATNPNAIGPTPQFKIKTYRAFPGDDTTLIDENLNAGTVTISSVDNPYFVEVDMYKAYVNTTLNGVGPLDFIVYPNTALDLSNEGVTEPGLILQIPLWWWAVASSGRYRCNFGALDSGENNGCTHRHQKFTIITPETKGLTTCDLPISIENVRVTPIPGSWPFRVHTFDEQLGNDVPLEQDLYYMDIPPDPFTNFAAESVSLDANDNDAVLRVRLQVGVQIPYEGAINMNFSVNADIFENTAAWDPELGFNFGGDTFVKVSCRIEVGGVVVGYTGANIHPDANCVAFKSDGTSNAIVQVRGFSQGIGSGTWIEIDVPNMKMCGDLTMNCVFQLTSAYTTTLDDPYTLNYETVNLGTIQAPGAVATGALVTPGPTFSQPMICRVSTWTFTFNAVQPLGVGSHLLLKFPSQKFLFDRAGIGSSISTQPVDIIYNYETDEIYYLIRVTTASTNPITFTLTNLRNSMGEERDNPEVTDLTGVDIKMIYWSETRAELEHLTFDTTAAWTDGGIWNTGMTFLPDAVPPFVRNLNFDDWIPFTITFTVCHPMYDDDGIEITVPVADYQAVSTDCQVWQGLTGISTNNGFTSQLNCYLDTDKYKVEGFNPTDWLTTITIGFTIHSNTFALGAPNDYSIRTYYDTTYLPAVENDYINNVGGIAIPGPRIFPHEMDFIDWLSEPRITRVNSLGTFTLTVNVNTPIPAWTAGVDPHILFTLDPTMGINPTSYPECRINGDISYHCEPVGAFQIRMRTNQFNVFPANTDVEVVITTLGAFNSDNYRDGIVFTQAGKFTLEAQTFISGAALESSQLEFEVFGERFLKYWVYALNKGRGGITPYIIHITLDAGQNIPASDNVAPALKGKIVVEFKRTQTTGFAFDLGTGIADRDPIPCTTLNLNIIAPATDVTCTLIHGLFDNPVKIELDGFDATGAGGGIIDIHIPNVINPNHAADFDIPEVVVRIYEVDTITGNENELYYHGYDLINVTYPQNPATIPVVIATAPTLTSTALNDPATLRIRVEPTYGLFAADNIVFELPLFWKPPKIMTCRVGGVARQCVGYADAKQILMRLGGGVAAQIPVGGSLVELDILTPPALIPASATIKAYYYHEFKLWNTADYPALGTALVPYVITDFTITADTYTLGAVASYQFRFVPVEDIPDGGAIRIQVPSQYTLPGSPCINDAVGGSLLGDAGFTCTVDTTTNEFVISGFPAFPAGDPIVIQALMQNPAAAAPIDDFRLETHYIMGTPLETLICERDMTGPALTNPPVITDEYWEEQYTHREYVYATQAGPFEFLITLPTDLLSTEQLLIEVPIDFDLAPEGQPDCYWDNYAADQCHFDQYSNPKVLTIHTPTGIDITGGVEHYLKVSTLNAKLGEKGIVHAVTPGLYTLTLKTTPDNGATVKEQQNVRFQVYATPFTWFTSTAELTNQKLKNSIIIEFQPETAIPAGTASLIVYFPTKNEFGVTLFDDDLRSGIADGDPIACHDMQGTLGGEPTCVLNHGNQVLGTPAKVTVTGITNNLNTGTRYKFRVNQLYNPIVGGANKHVVMLLESYNGGALINAGLHYDFTIQPYDPNQITWTAAARRPTTVPSSASQADITFTIDLISDRQLFAANLFDYFIIQFPPQIQQPLGVLCVSITNTECTSLPGNNWVVYDRNTDVAASTVIDNLLLLKATQAPGQMTGAIFITYAVENRLAITEVINQEIDLSAVVLQAPVASVATNFLSLTEIPYDAPIKYTLTFDISNTGIVLNVPAEGAIEIELDANLTPVDNFCSNNPASTLTGDYVCTVAGQIYTITDFDAFGGGSTIKIDFWASSTAPSITPNFIMRLFEDQGKVIKMAENNAIAGDPISAYTGFSKIYPIDTEPLNPFAVRAGNVAPFRAKVSPGPNFVDHVIVTFPATVSIPAGARLFCGWDDYEANYCTATSTTPLTIEVYAPHSPALVTTQTYELLITTYGMNGSPSQGLQYSTAGKGVVTVSDGVDTLNVPIDIHQTDFTSVRIHPFWANSNAKNHFGFEVQVATAIPATGKIVVTFPQTTVDGRTALFSPDLGTGQASGTEMFCTTEDTLTMTPQTDQIKCNLIYGRDQYSYVEIYNFQAISGGSSIRFFIRGVTNPNAADTGHVYLILHSEDGAGAILNKRYVYDVISTQSVTFGAPGYTGGSYTKTPQQDVQLTSRTFAFTSLAMSKLITTRSKIIIEFREIFTIPTTVSVTVTVGGANRAVTHTSYANFLVITPTVDFGAGSLDITVGGVPGPISADDTTDINSSINLYLIYYTAYEDYYRLTALPANNYTPSTITVSSFTSSSTEGNLETDYYFTLQFNKNIPYGGAIRVEMPGFTSITRGRITSSAKTPVTFSTSGTTGIFTFGRTYRPSDGDIDLQITGTAPTGTAAVTFTIGAYQNPTSTARIISQGTQVWTPATSATVGTMYISSSQLRTSTDSNLVAHYTLNAATSTVGLDTIRVQIGNFAAPGGPQNCEVNGVAPTTCNLAGSTLTMNGGFTMNANPADNEIKFVLQTPGATGSQRLVIETVDSTGPTVRDKASDAVIISSTAFTAMTTTLGHLSTIYPNFAEIDVTLGGTAVTDPVGYIEFMGFSSTLSPSYTTGSSVPCSSPSAASLQCILEAGTGTHPPRLKLVNLPNLAAAANLIVRVFRFDSPTNEGQTAINFKLSEITIGNRETDIYSSATLHDFVAAAPATATSDLTLTTFTVQELETYDLGIPSQNSILGDEVIYMLPYQDYSGAAAPGCGVQCTFYDIGGIIHKTVAAPSTPHALTATNLENSPVVPVSSDVVAYFVRLQQVIGVYTLRPYDAGLPGSQPYTAGTITGASMTSLDDNTDAGPNKYLVSFTLPHRIPDGGLLRISLPTTGFSASPTASAFELLGGTYTGTPSMKSQVSGPNFHIDISGFTSWSAGAVSFYVKINNGMGAGSPAGSISTYADSAASLLIDTAAISFTYGATAKFNAYRDLPSIIGHTQTIKSGRGIFSFGFEQTSGSLTAATRLFRLKPATSFALSTTLIRCKFVNRATGESYISQECYRNSLLQYIISPPRSTALTVGEWQVLIYTPSSANNLRGIAFPATAVLNNFQINLEDLVGTIIESNSLRYKVFDKTAVSAGADYYVRNTGSEENLLSFDFQIATAFPATGTMFIEFPTLDPTGQINGLDLYTGLWNENEIFCTVRRNGALDTTAKCTLHMGSLHYYKPAYVKIVDFDAAGAVNANYAVTIAVKNGPTANIWNSARIYTQNAAGAYLDVYNVPKLTYTVTQAITTTTTTFPTAGMSDYEVQNSIDIDIDVNPGTPVTLTAANHRLRFGHNDRFYGGAAVQSIAGGHTIDVYSDAMSFVTFGSDPGATSQTFTFQNWVNPISDKVFTSEFKIGILENKVIYQDIEYTDPALPTFTFGTFSGITISPDSLAEGETTLYTVTFQSDKDVPAGGVFQVTFPAGYTVQPLCAGSVSSTCQVVGQDVQIIDLQQDVLAATSVSIFVYAQNPTAGVTGQFGLTSFEYNDLTGQIAENLNAGTVTITVIPGFTELIMLERKTDVWKVQSAQYGPLLFNLTLATPLANPGVDYVEVIFADNTHFFPEPPAQTIPQTDIICFWDRLAASRCQKSGNGYMIYTPFGETINAGENYYVQITTNRDPEVGFTFPAMDIYDTELATSQGESQIKKLIVPQEGFHEAWFTSRITTNDEETLLHVKFRPKVAIQPDVAATRSQVIIELPVMTINFTMFPTDLGTGYSNGDPVDCVSIGANFNCKLSIGAPAVSTPAGIILESTAVIAANTDVEVYIPFIKLPVDPHVRVYARMYLRQFDTILNNFVEQEEFLFQPVLITTTSVIETTQTNLAAPVFNPNNRVGEPSDVNFIFDLLADLDADTYDTIMIYTDTFGAEVPVVPATSVQGDTRTYTISKWAELQPMLLQGAAAGFQAQFTNWKNQPYVIAGGVKWYIYVWKDHNIIQKIDFDFTAEVDPHPLVPTPTLVTGNDKIRAVTELDFTFTPYNDIPPGGTIEINIDPDYMTIGPKCDITGLVGAYCTIQSDGDETNSDPKSVLVTATQGYTAGSSIKIVVSSRNPPTGGNTDPFELTTYWPTGEIIDQDLNYAVINIDASATYNVFDLVSLEQKRFKTCGGNPGPMKIKYRLRNGLTYPNDFITITLPPEFGQPLGFPVIDETRELLCYFKYSDVYNLKTHRCDMNGQDIIFYAPEEKDFLANEYIELTITSRGADTVYQDGIVVPAVPGDYFVRVTTSNNLEEAYLIARIEPCPFNNFLAESAVWESGEKTLFNFYAQTTSTMPSSGNGGRIVVEIPTHNEIIATFDPDLGTGIGVSSSELFGCGSVCTNCPGTNALNPDTGTHMECTMLTADAQTWGDSTVIFTSNIQQINIGSDFNFQLARIPNAVGVGWPYFYHIRIRTQQRQADGSYIDLNDHWAYFLVPAQYVANGLAVGGGTGFFAFTNNQVNQGSEVRKNYQAGDTVDLLDVGDYIIYEWDPRDVELPNRITCEEYVDNIDRTAAWCASMRDGSWMNMQLTIKYPLPWTFRLYGYRQPHYRVNGGFTIREYHVRQHRIIGIYDHNGQNVNRDIYVVMQTPSNTNDAATEFKYQIGVVPQTNIVQVKYFRLWMPDIFINPHDCTIRRGLVPQDVNDPTKPVVCQITTSGGYHMFEFYDFYYNGDGWFIFDITITNPAAPQLTPAWQATSYDNYLVDLTRTIDSRGNADGQTWVGILPITNYFRVFRNTISHENRRAAEGEWAEVHVRVQTKNAVPPNSGRVEVWLPTEFDIPNGGDIICEIGHDYHDDLEGQSCSISADRKIYMNTDPVHGIPANTCSLIRSTTENSIGGNNGFQTPEFPGDYNFDVFFYDGSVLKEFSSPSPTIEPDPLPSIDLLRIIEREENEITVVRIGFQTPRTIPAGYDTDELELDIFNKAPIGTIYFDFNTKESFSGWNGWRLDLGLPSTDVPCKVFTGLVPREGYDAITCTLIPSTKYNPKNPARVILQDFEEVIEGTDIEIHLMNIRNPPNQQNNGRISIGAFQTYGDGSIAEIIEATDGFQSPINRNAITTQDIVAGLVINPNTVGSTLIVDFSWNTDDHILAGDNLILAFPTTFELPDDGSISAVMDLIELEVTVYNDPRVNEIYLEMPAGNNIFVAGAPGEIKTVRLSQLRNIAYADPNLYEITLTQVRATRRQEIVRFMDNVPAIASEPNSAVVTLSSQFSGDVFVQYDYTIVPSYHIPSGATFQIKLPSPEYDHMFSSSPAAVCNLISVEVENCAYYQTPGVGNYITFEAADRIEEATPISIQYTGVKNPTYVGTLTGFEVDIIHPNSYFINQGTFSDITFATAKSPDKISMTISASSNFRTVNADYVFALQNSNQLPPGGQIILDFPANWKTILPGGFDDISTLTSSFSTSKLQYTDTYTAGTGRLVINTLFTWPAKTEVYVRINGLTNPNIAITDIFKASTIYDGVTIDQTNPTDLSNRVAYDAYSASVSLRGSSLYPQNEGEASTFVLNLTSINKISSGTEIEIAFPSEFGSTLTTTDKTVTCRSPQFPDLQCTIVDGKITIPATADIGSGGNLDIEIVGITNPNEGTTTSGISITTRKDGQTLGFTSNVVPSITTTVGPESMDLTKLTTTSTNLQTKATYEICAETDGAIPANAQIFVEFPEQFTLKRNSYECGVGETNVLNYPSGVSCSPTANMRRFTFTGQDNSFAAGTMREMCYTIADIENPADSGESDPFVFAIYDPSTQQVLYRSYGILSYPTTIDYKREGLKITVATIADFSVGLMSDFITVTLERKVPYKVELTPTAEGFTFQPEIIEFNISTDQSLPFRILPNSATPAGSYFIEWAKNEHVDVDKFSQVPSSPFNYVSKVVAYQYQVILGTTVSRTALGGTSLPIKIRLTQSPAQNMTISYTTIKPLQPDYVVFDPAELVFTPGELEKTFDYKTNIGAISGLMEFTVDPNYANIYFMEENQLNFEILDIDYDAPFLENDYIVELERTYMYYRISSSESCWAYYLLTKRGTVEPPIDEIIDPTLREVRGTKTDVIEITGRNGSEQIELTQTYIYHDTYLKFEGLEEETHYVMYFVLQDLSGNNREVKAVPFQTLTKHQPARFTISFTANVDPEDAKTAFALVTSIDSSRWIDEETPDIFTIPNNTDPVVQEILQDETVIHQYMLLQDPTSDEERPIDSVAQLQYKNHILVETLPELDMTYDINYYSYEVLQFEQEITSTPEVIDIFEDNAKLNISIKRNGTMYGVVLPKGSTKPFSEQIKGGLNASNFLVEEVHRIKEEFLYTPDMPYEWTYEVTVLVEDLLDNTVYEAHFVADNDLPVNPDLLRDDQIVTVELTTKKEYFSLPDDYTSAWMMPPTMISLLCVLAIIFV